MKLLIAVLLAAAAPAAAQVKNTELSGELLEASLACIVQRLSIVETVRCSIEAEKPLRAKIATTPELNAAIDALDREMLADAAQADAKGEPIEVFMQRWQRPSRRLIARLKLPQPKVTPPNWQQKPTAQKLSAAYPAALMTTKTDAAVALTCIVKLDGSLADCQPSQELPPGHGVADAAMSLTPDIRMRPMTINGRAVESLVQVPVRFDYAVSRKFFDTAKGR